MLALRPTFCQRVRLCTPRLGPGLHNRMAATAAGPAAAPPLAGTARRPRVAVIGAGFAGESRPRAPGLLAHRQRRRQYNCLLSPAGLAAALTLERSRCCDVVVLEASGRTGGRACTQRLSPELALELGATWFHGLGSDGQPNPVFRHAVQQGLIGSAPEGERNSGWGRHWRPHARARPDSK